MTWYYFSCKIKRLLIVFRVLCLERKKLSYCRRRCTRIREKKNDKNRKRKFSACSQEPRKQESQVVSRVISRTLEDVPKTLKENFEWFIAVVCKHTVNSVEYLKKICCRSVSSINNWNRLWTLKIYQDHEIRNPSGSKGRHIYCSSSVSWVK